MKPNILLLALLGSCRALDTEEGDKSGENEGSGTLPDDCTPSDEVPYDGIDQDCDGSDLVDVDGDGQDGSEVGGDDCDDGDPATYAGASENPYDGIDQDCDGSDLVDVDGDGHAGTEAGGDDCLDSDAGAYPGADEETENGVDDDCDGYADEVVVCLDGSGDFESIQDAVDDAPDGGTVVLCPGEYQEAVQVKDKDISIVGNPDDPDLVVWHVTSGALGLTLVGSSSALRYFQFRTDDAESWIAGATDASELTLSGVHIFAGAPAKEKLSILAADESSSLVVELSKVESTLLNPLGPHYRVNKNELLGSVVWGTPGASASVANNIWQPGGSQISGFWSMQCLDTPSGTTEFRNNTLVDLELFWFADGEWWGECAPTHLNISNNIFSGIARYADTTGETTPGSAEQALWHSQPFEMSNGSSVFLEAGYLSTLDVQTTTNLVFQSPAPWADATCYYFGPNYEYYGSNTGLECQVVDEIEEFSSRFRAGFVEGDPEFSATGAQGSFALGTNSAAKDAGTGDPDPDGSPNDIGAFGGPDGNWYEEYSWPLN